MRRFRLPVLLALCLLAINLACDTAGPEGGLVMLSGQVLSSGTNNPISDAVIRLPDLIPEAITTTDAQGAFTMEVDVDSTMDLRLTAFKEGYATQTVQVLAVPGRTIVVPPLHLQPTTAETPVSGSVASLSLSNLSTPSIGVLESGALETVQLQFRANDSTGQAIDLAHATEIAFRFGAHPEGGEFLSPTTVRTDNNGLATVNLTSGTKAGTVQVVAETTVGGKVLRSKPVAVAIHGGLPDASHFSVGPARLNFPGYNVLGLNNPITAYVGDKYGNPVRPETVVYFTTTGGIIEGSALTNNQGGAGATLISAAPQPFHSVHGAGYATITASTANETGATIPVETLVLFSGVPELRIGDYGDLEIGQSYTYTVSDQNGNPLAEGTTINVTVEGENVRAVGNTSISLGDVLFRGRGVTEFRFLLAKEREQDEEGNVLPVRIDGVKITVSGPNGRVEATLGPAGAFKVSRP